MVIQSDIFVNFSLFLKELESGNGLENTGGLEGQLKIPNSILQVWRIWQIQIKVTKILQEWSKTSPTISQKPILSFAKFVYSYHFIFAQSNDIEGISLQSTTLV